MDARSEKEKKVLNIAGCLSELKYHLKEGVEQGILKFSSISYSDRKQNMNERKE